MKTLLTILAITYLVIFSACGGGGNSTALPENSDNTESQEEQMGSVDHVTNIIPFNYTLESDHIAIQTDGEIIKASIGAYGAHSTPHTGHAEGKIDVDWSGHYAFRFEDLTEVPGIDGNDDGIPDEGETCGIHYTEIDERIPHYTSPVDNLRITSVVLSIKTDDISLYYEHGNHWGISSDISNNAITIGMGHVRNISTDLVNALVAAGYKNPITQIDEIEEGEELITGDPVYLNQGDKICTPQIQGLEIESTGYYELPIAQIEFSIGLPYYYEENQWGTYYAFFSADELEQWESVLQNEAAYAESYRYNSVEHHDWLWKAESVLSTFEYVDTANYYSAIFTPPGSWVEQDRDLDSTDPLNDEMFVIFPIMRSSPLTGLANPLYDPDLYHSPDVNYLAYKHKDEGVEWPQDSDFPKWGEIISPFTPDPTSGEMIIKWRTKSLDPPLQETRYQGLKYYLNSTEEYLKISWTAEFEDEAGANIALDDINMPNDSTICDGINTKKYKAFYE